MTRRRYVTFSKRTKIDVFFTSAAGPVSLIYTRFTAMCVCVVWWCLTVRALDSQRVRLPTVPQSAFSNNLRQVVHTIRLRQLHWLPVCQRVVFKIAGLVRQSLVGAAPAYLADDCRLLSDVGRRPLRSNSNDMRKLFVPRTHNKLADGSFLAAGSRLRNDLPLA